MDVIVGSGMIPVLVLPECAVGQHVQFYDEINVDRCTNCGSSLFRNYVELNTEKEDWIQQICAVCGQRLGEFKR